MSGWTAILDAARAERARFQRACEEPRETQLSLLQRLLADNTGSQFGREHRFDRIDGVERFRAAVPIRNYDAMEPWIRAEAAGERCALTALPVVAFEETGGSTSGHKLIPYTTESLAAFRAAVLPWLSDLAEQRPETFAGRAYVALSPVARAPRRTSGGTPIGLPSEAAYLGTDLARALAPVLAVPADVALEREIERWRFLTLRHLLTATDLSFISVWSPTFLIGLIEALSTLVEPLCKAMHDAGDPDRARLLRRAVAGRRIGGEVLWPQLATISAWADGASTSYAEHLREMFPQAELQPKGLLATEGPVTLPWRGSPHAVPALLSAFLEFIDDAGRPFLCDELREGVRYRIVMTTPGGLYRYDLGDYVRCRGHAAGLPRLEFLGRTAQSDIVGEKLSEDFVAAALAGIGTGVCLAARRARTPFYELLIDAMAGEDMAPHAALVEQRLCANPQYAYARAVGQLASVKPRALPGLLDRHSDAQARRGCRLADIKPPVLISDAAAYDALTGADAR